MKGARMSKDEKAARALFRTPAGQAWMKQALTGKVTPKASANLQATRANLAKKRGEKPQGGSRSG
jgi:hypothetical protein